MTELQKHANDAVFCLQLSSRDAINYIARNAQVTQDQAKTQFQRTVTFYKKK